MTKGYAKLDAARDLRAALRCDNFDDEERPEVRAVILTTHDFDLRFALAELLPGYLQDPTTVPPGLGPAHRSYRQAMLDLPPTSIVFATEAGLSLDVPWRPPSLALVPYHPNRRQHAKVAAILLADDDGRQQLRLVAGSANLTRRAFSNNLEVAAVADYELNGRQYPALFALRGFLEHLGETTNLGETDAYRLVVEALPESRGRREDGDLEFVHSVDPAEFSAAIAGWLGTPPRGLRKQAMVVASPFFPQRGTRLLSFCRDRLGLSESSSVPFTLVLDGRGADATSEGSARNEDEPWSTPPPWLDELRAPGSSTFVPAVLSRKRGVHEGFPFRGTGQRGRALHAKLIATRFGRSADDSDGIVRMFLGSANFTEAGLGLLGKRSNLEAGFLLARSQRDESCLRFGPVQESLCVEHALARCPERAEGPDLGKLFEATARAKEVIAILEGGACTIALREGGYELRVKLPVDGVAAPEIWLGKFQFERDKNGVYCLSCETLAPYHLRIVLGDVTTCWPLPASDEAVRLSLVTAAGARRRVDRLLEFWLNSSATPAELVDEDADGAGSDAAGAPDAGQTHIGSWRLNRLMLGVRRRLAESVKRIGLARLPSAANLLQSIRIRELLELVVELPDPDALYLGVHVKGMLFGYRAAELRRNRDSIAALDDDEIVAAWKETEVWARYATRLREASRVVPPKVRALLDEAAEKFFLSVREGEVVT